jgi:hypothetical protein
MPAPPVRSRPCKVRETLAVGGIYRCGSRRPTGVVINTDSNDSTRERYISEAYAVTSDSQFPVEASVEFRV